MSHKYQRTEDDAALLLNGRPLTAALTSLALSYLTCTDLNALLCTSSSMRAVVAKCCIAAYWDEKDEDAGLSRIYHLATKLQSIWISGGARRSTCEPLVRANKGTLRAFHATEGVEAEMLDALGGCRNLASLSYGFIVLGKVEVSTSGPLSRLRSLQNLTIPFTHICLFDRVGLSSLQELHLERPRTFSGERFYVAREEMQRFSNAVPHLESLRELHLPGLSHLSRRISLPGVSCWTFPSLISLHMSTSLQFLPRLEAPFLRRIEAHFTFADVEQLMEGCPELEVLRGSLATFPDCKGPSPDLASRILGATPGTGGACRWPDTLTELTGASGVIGAAALSAIGMRWTRLTALDCKTDYITPPAVIRTLLTGLPSLRRLAVYLGNWPGSGETLSASHAAAAETTLHSPATALPLAEEKKSLQSLEHLRLTIADDATFAGLSFPSLRSLTLCSPAIRVSDVGPVLSRMPSLVALTIDSAVTLSIQPQPGLTLPSSCTSLRLRRCSQLHGAALSALLGAMPLLRELEVEECELLSPEAVLAYLLANCPWAYMKSIKLLGTAGQESPALDSSLVATICTLFDVCPQLTVLFVAYRSEREEEEWDAEMSAACHVLDQRLSGRKDASVYLLGLYRFPYCFVS